MRHLLFAAITLCVFSFSVAGQGKAYATVRVYESNKYVGAGNFYVASRIILMLETGESETIELQPHSEKNAEANQRKIVEALNNMKKRGYLLMSSSTTGEQGQLISEYVFFKQ